MRALANWMRFAILPPMPDWSYESEAQGPVAGVDEAGRGPLAGPVVAAAAILDLSNIPEGLDDSKKLSASKREALFTDIITSAQIGVGVAEPEEIDRLNVLHASMAAMARAVAALPRQPALALIDGNRAPLLPCPARAIVKGDAKSFSIAAASIIAKVTRDRIMAEAEDRFPGYGLARHKGYPTRAHREALAQLGLSPIHRRSFKPQFEMF